MHTLSTAKSNEETSTPLDPYVPTDLDGVPITWDGNPAKIIGKLRATSEFYTRTGLFKTYIAKRSVSLSNGKTAYESLDSVPFALGALSDLPAGKEHAFNIPCPPTPTRITAYNSTPAGTAKAYASTDYTSLLDTHKHSIIISPDLVDKTGRDFADSLILIVSDKDAAATYLAAANYDGNNLIKVLTGVATDATGSDHSLMHSEYTQFIASPMTDPLSLTSFNSQYKKLKDKISSLPQAIPEEQVIATLHMWVNRDPDFRRDFKTLCTVKPPSSNVTSEHLKLIRGMLRDEAVRGEIDALYGARQAALTSRPPAAKSAAEEKQAAAVSAISKAMALTDKKKREKAVLEALIANGVDPIKNLKSTEPGGAGAVEVPRDAENRVIRWVAGMNTCGCKGKGSPSGTNDGGKHLFRDCTKKKTRDKPPTQATNVSTLIPNDDESEEDRLARYGAFFDHISNASVAVDSDFSVGQDLAAEAGRLLDDDVFDLASALGVDAATASFIHSEALEGARGDSTCSLGLPSNLLSLTYASTYALRAHTITETPYTVDGQVGLRGRRRHGYVRRRNATYARLPACVPDGGVPARPRRCHFHP